MQKRKNIIFGQTGVRISFADKRNLLMECLDTNSKTIIITDPKTDLGHLKKVHKLAKKFQCKPTIIT